MKQNKKLYIMSFDGLSKIDISKIEKMPNFKKFFQFASGCKSVESVYPTLTYSAHTSITTGVYPAKHGIINNTKLQMYKNNPDWYWYESEIKRPTFQELANKNGYEILSILWPVMGKSKYIKYNMPEIFSNKIYRGQIYTSLRAGTPSYQIKMFLKFFKLIKRIAEPYLDNFIHAAYLYSIENYNADINMIHYIDLDYERHRYGFNSKEANIALERLDRRLGDIIKTLKKCGKYEDAVIVILGDHSSIDGENNIYLNTLFYKLNYLEKLNKNKVGKYKIVSKSCDGSSYIYADKNIKDEEIIKIIKPLEERGILEKIYNNKEIIKLGADPSARFMLEAKRGYFFKNEIMDRIIIPVKEAKTYINNHGYSPYLKEDYETVFFISGKGIKKGKWIDYMRLVDEGPTFAKIMGFEMKNTDGKAIDEFML